MKIAKVALITGITGQDGSYLAELLLQKGYEVHGIVRRSSLINTHRIDHIYKNIHLHYGDLTDATNLIGVIKKVEPDEICLLYTSPSPRDPTSSRMPSSA